MPQSFLWVCGDADGSQHRAGLVVASLVLDRRYIVNAPPFPQQASLHRLKSGQPRALSKNKVAQGSSLTLNLCRPQREICKRHLHKAENLRSGLHAYIHRCLRMHAWTYVHKYQCLDVYGCIYLYDICII